MRIKRQKNEQGIVFVVAIIMAVLVLGIVGFAGYKIYQRNHGGGTAQTPTDLAAAHNALGFNTLRELNHGQDKNVFISPTSISLALSMVYNGAGSTTKQAMTDTLEFEKLDTTKVNQESLGLIKQLKNPDDGVELAIANSVWTRQGTDVKPDFTKAVHDYFNAQNTTLNFKDASSVKAINDWVSDNTNGKIPKIVESLDDSLVMLLINATYFKGSWTTAFEKTSTEDKTFTPSKGAPYKTPLMSRYDNLPYYETNDFQSVSLSYGKNERLSMYVFLPKNLEAFTDSLTIEKWSDWMQKYEKTDGTILLPRFKLDYEVQLNDVLTKLGMGVAFSESAADFTGIGKDMHISEVKHKTFLDVNEEGTEAAAVTSVGVSTTSAVVSDKKEFYMEVNKPFFIAIVDSKTNEILFAGAIHQPVAN